LAGLSGLKWITVTGKPDGPLVGAMVRLKKRGGTYRVAAWNDILLRYTLHYVHPEHRRGVIRRVYACADELVLIDDRQAAVPGVPPSQTPRGQ
jgi:hypothetical protein